MPLAEGLPAGVARVATHFLRMGMPCAMTCSKSLPACPGHGTQQAAMGMERRKGKGEHRVVGVVTEVEVKRDT